MTSSTAPGAADKVASRPAVDHRLPQAPVDLTNAKKPLGGKRLRQRPHRLGRKIEDVVVTFKDIARDAHLEGCAAASATATQNKGPRPKNAERRRRKQHQGQFGIDDHSYRGQAPSAHAMQLDIPDFMSCELYKLVNRKKERSLMY